MSVDAEVEAVLQHLADDPCTVARWRPDERVLSVTLLRGAVVVPISILVPEAGVPMFAYATDDGTSSEVAALCERISSAPTLPALISELLSVSSIACVSSAVLSPSFSPSRTSSRSSMFSSAAPST